MTRSYSILNAPAFKTPEYSTDLITECLPIVLPKVADWITRAVESEIVKDYFTTNPLKCPSGIAFFYLNENQTISVFRSTTVRVSGGEEKPFSTFRASLYTKTKNEYVHLTLLHASQKDFHEDIILSTMFWEEGDGVPEEEVLDSLNGMSNSIVTRDLIPYGAKFLNGAR